MTGVHNVTDSPYNAVGNGTANDTAAIQAALDAARPQGEIVYFPAGVYRITAPLRIKKLDNVSGAGNAEIRLRPISLIGASGGEGHGNWPSGSGASMILVDFNGVGLDLTRAADDTSRAQFYGRLSGLSFHKNGAKESASAIRAYSVVNARFENMQVRGFDTGIKVGDETITGAENGGGWYSVWRRVKFLGNNLGVWCPALMHGSRWVDCVFSSSQGQGGKWGHDSPSQRCGTPITFDDCYVEGCAGIGMQFFGGELVNINGCYLENNTGAMIDFRTTSSAQGALVVRGCHIRRTSNGDYINVVAGDAQATISVILIGNDFQRSGTTAQEGLVAVNIDANPGRVSIIDHGSINFKVLSGSESGRSPVELTNADLGDLRAFDCACSQLHANQADGAFNGRSE